MEQEYFYNNLKFQTQMLGYPTRWKDRYSFNSISVDTQAQATDYLPLTLRKYKYVFNVVFIIFISAPTNFL